MTNRLDELGRRLNDNSRPGDWPDMRNVLHYIFYGIIAALLGLVLVVVFAVAADAKTPEAYHPAAHDNYIDQGRCRTVPDHGYTRCTIARGRQWIRSGDGDAYLAIAVWHPNRERPPWLIARSLETGKIRAYPAGGSGGGVVLFIGPDWCSRNPDPRDCDGYTFRFDAGITRSTLRRWADEPMTHLPDHVGRALWEYGYRQAGGRNLPAFDQTILPCESEWTDSPDAAVGPTHDYGRAQINRAVWRTDFEESTGLDWPWIHDPHYNGRQAAKIEHVQGLDAWVCYT